MNETRISELEKRLAAIEAREPKSTKRSSPGRAASKSKRGAHTLYLSAPLMALAQEYVTANKREKSVSLLVERLLLRHIATKARRYRLQIPDELIKEGRP